METFFLNMFFGAKIKGMPPKLQSDDGKHIVIRPLAYVKEADTERYAQVKNFPIIPCDLCGSQENLQRKQIKNMLREWEKKHPGRVDNIFSSLSTVVPSHLMDRDLFGFTELKATGEAMPNGDIAFDEEPCSTGTAIPSIIPLHSRHD
jgi:tRNA 2-thiocytidine biosynthesis protein TtcA